MNIVFFALYQLYACKVSALRRFVAFVNSLLFCTIMYRVGGMYADVNAFENPWAGKACLTRLGNEAQLEMQEHNEDGCYLCQSS